MNYTKAERGTIANAFDTIAHFLDTTDMRMPYEWREALKSEKRECTNIHSARALMCREFAAGIRHPLDAADLYRIRDGARMAHMIGAELMARRPDSFGAANARQYLRDDLAYLCDLAVTSHDKAMKRAHDKAIADIREHKSDSTV